MDGAAQGGRSARRWLGKPCGFLGLVLWAAVLLLPSPLHAEANYNDLFKSIHDNVEQRSTFDPRPVIFLALAGGVVLAVVLVAGRRQQKAAAPVAMNHAGKLVKEVLREAPLKAAELKQLKLLADSAEAELGEAPNPLTLLICPSLLAKGLKANPAKLDRKTVAQVVRRMKLNQDAGS